MKKIPLKLNEYQCAVCHEVFYKGWTDEEATTELAETFAVPVDECDLVCDDCFKEMGFK